MRETLLTSLLTIIISSCFGQITNENEGHTLRNTIKEDTLVDNELRMRFVLDSSRIKISAYDFSNKLVWSTDPWLDNKLIEYRVKRPVLVYYSLKANWKEDDKKLIWITYNNSQFGTVDRRTGKFNYMGKD